MGQKSKIHRQFVAKLFGYLAKEKDSYFADCPRDDEGHCKPSGQSDSGPKEKPGQGKPSKGPESGAKPGGKPAESGTSGGKTTESKPGGSNQGQESDKKQKPTKQGDKSQPSPIKLAMMAHPIRKEPTTPVPEGKPEFNPNVHEDSSGNGVTDTARVGVPGDAVPPPPPIARLPNLTEDEREVESRFADAYEEDPEKFADEYLKALKDRKVGDAENIFATDDAKFLSGDYNPYGVSPEESKAAKSRYNTAVHQTANAIAKRAFIKYLDDVVANLPDDKKTVLVTSGGVGSGKDYAMGQIDEVNSIAKHAGAVWNAAGEQNATENPWVLAECEKRGIKATFVFVNADPITTWGSAQGGVVERAKKKGRMVDARPYAESYVIGAKNFHTFHQQNKDNKNASFFIINNPRGAKAEIISEVPEESRNADIEHIYESAVGHLTDCDDCSADLKRGGLSGLRLWPDVFET